MSSPAAVIGKGLGSAVSTGIAGAGAWVFAQAGGLGDIPELIGGSVVLAAGLLSLRMVLRASKHERESAQEVEARLTRDLERAEGRAEELELELNKERHRAARLLIAFDRERNLRLSLEAAGLTERRQPPNGDSLELIDLGDVADLTTELEVELNGNIEDALEEMPEEEGPEA